MTLIMENHDYFKSFKKPMIGSGGHKRVPFSFYIYKPLQIRDLSLSIYQKVVKEIANLEV